jgi:hypothetical protein
MHGFFHAHRRIGALLYVISKVAGANEYAWMCGVCVCVCVCARARAREFLYINMLASVHQLLAMHIRTDTHSSADIQREQDAKYERIPKKMLKKIDIRGFCKYVTGIDP